MCYRKAHSLDILIFNQAGVPTRIKKTRESFSWQITSQITYMKKLLDTNHSTHHISAIYYRLKGKL